MESNKFIKYIYVRRNRIIKKINKIIIEEKIKNMLQMRTHNYNTKRVAIYVKTIYIEKVECIYICSP